MVDSSVSSLMAGWDAVTQSIRGLQQQVTNAQGQYSQSALSPNYVPAQQPSLSPPNTFGNGGGGATGWSPLTGMNGGNLPPGSTNILGALNMGGALGGIKALVNYGASQLPNQIAMNTAVQYASYMGNNPPMAMLRQMTGSGGVGANAVPQNMQDAMQMLSTMQQFSGQQMLTPGSLGGGVAGGAQAAGYLTPGLSGTQAAQFSTSLYNPTLSYQLRVMGVNPQPRALGHVSTTGQVLSGLLQRMGATGISPQQFAGFMRPGGTGQAELQFLTAGAVNPTQLTTMLEAMQTMNAHGGTTNAESNALTHIGMGNAAGASAQSYLSAHGIHESAIMQLQSALAPNMSRSADMYNSFQIGLDQATGLVAKWNNLLARMSHGIAGILGYAGGISGLAQTLEPGATGFLGGTGGSFAGSLIHSLVQNLIGRAIWKRLGKPLLSKGWDLLKGLGSKAWDLAKAVGGKVGDFATSGSGFLFGLGGAAATDRKSVV